MGKTLNPAGMHFFYPSIAQVQRGYSPERVIAPLTEIWTHCDTWLGHIVGLEARTYEPARRDTPEHLGHAFTPGGVFVMAWAHTGREKQLLGCALATPLEHVHYITGPDRDEQLGQHSTCYSLAVTVDRDLHGRGLGRLMKEAQVTMARHAGYRFMTSRNREGEAQPMAALNLSLGAQLVTRLEGQYGGEGVALYYRLALDAAPI